MLKIGEFSTLAQVSVKTLRYYDELGLLKPDWVDRFTGYRYYTLQQLPRLNRILTLKELGFSLVQIERLLQEDLSVEELRRLMHLRQAEIEQQMREEQTRLNRVAARLRMIEQEGKQPHYEVMIKRIPASLVAGIRDTVADPAEILALIDELHSCLNSWGMTPGPLTPFTAIYYDMEYVERGADVEVLVPLERRQRSRGRVVVHELAGIEMAACLVHEGDRDGLPGAYQTLARWTQLHGYHSGKYSREVYLQGFAAGKSVGKTPMQAVTELQLPIESITTSFSKEKAHMQPKIVTKPAFTVVGLPFGGFVSHSPYENGEQNNEIGKVWDQFNARIGEVPNISGPVYGLCFGMPNDKEPWYIAGIEVERVTELPAGMISRTVPEQRYAVFPCTLQTLGQTYRYIQEEWQPTSGYEHASAPDFEYYDDSEPSAPEEMKLSVYWPIK